MLAIVLGAGGQRSILTATADRLTTPLSALAVAALVIAVRHGAGGWCRSPTRCANCVGALAKYSAVTTTRTCRSRRRRAGLAVVKPGFNDMVCATAERHGFQKATRSAATGEDVARRALNAAPSCSGQERRRGAGLSTWSPTHLAADHSGRRGGRQPAQRFFRVIVDTANRHGDRQQVPG